MPELTINELSSFIKSNFSKEPHIYLLEGDLGSGKTTFTKEFLRYIDVDSSEINSPTYSLIQKYEHDKFEIYHIDLYRLKSSEELESTGIEEILENDNAITIIEWPQILGQISQIHTKIKFKHGNKENTRIIELS